ncbi:MAG TPA: hypothetical protein VKI44_15055 [Acetobacteraceae bacterium]|nr:hypothetical protein [Acetobacteraceae bacterium]
MANRAMRAEFVAALDVELARVGAAAFKVEPVVTAFLDRGAASRTTLFRWGQELAAIKG